MAAPDYCDIQDLKDRLGIGLNDPREGALQNAVTGASRWVEKQTGRRFYTVTETRYYSPTWHYPRASMESSGYYGDYPWGNPERPTGGGFIAQRIMLDDFVSVSQVQTDTDGDGVYDATWTVGRDYWLGPRNATAEGKPFRSLNRNIVTGVYVFPPWENSVSVTGACGYSATTPDEIRELTIQAAMLLSRPVMEMSIPGVSSYQLTSDIRITMAPEDLSPMARTILQHYQDPIFSM